MAEPQKTSSFNRWAVVVGISNYQDESLNLGYADRDARAFYDLIRSPSGGDFKEDHIVFLVNEDATTRRITQALRSFLKKPAKEDLVVIYMACHGSPDPERPSNVYLLTHDVDRDDISGTGVPMKEIDSALRHILHAEKVVIIADTCHSAAIGGGPGLRDASFAAETVNNYLDAVSQAKAGTALITSCEANETAQESEKFGGGHGVFTHYLLEGMRGAADTRPKNGHVTLGELFEYVRDNVKEATGHSQHPSIGTTQFDRELPIAVPGIQRSRELVEKAQACFDAGDYDEAERLWSEARELSPDSPDAILGLDRIKTERERQAHALRRRQTVLREYFEAKKLTALQYNDAMRLLGKADSLSNKEASHRNLLMSLVEKQIDVSVYKDSIEALTAPGALESEDQRARVPVEKRPSPGPASGDSTRVPDVRPPPPDRQGREPQGESRRWIALLFVLGLFAVLMLAWMFWPVAGPQIESFNASHTSITQGESTTLSWRTTDADRVELSGESVPLSGSRNVTPLLGEIYVLVAYGPGGERSKSVRIDVSGVLVRAPVIESFTVDRSSMIAGESVRLAWHITGADSVRLEPGGSFVKSSDFRSVSPSEDTVYELFASGPGGDVSRSVPIEVSPPRLVAPTIDRFSADRTSIIEGDSVTLSWETTGATRVEILGVPRTPDSFVTFTPSKSQGYELIAYGPGGTTAATVNVEVLPAPEPAPVIATFSADRTAMFVGESVRLSWRVTGADSVRLNPGGTSGNLIDTRVVSPSEDTLYTLVVSGPGGERSKTVRIAVSEAPVAAPVIDVFSADRQSVTSGEPVTLTWQTTGATSARLEPGSFAVGLNGTRNETPLETTEYRLTISGPGGGAARSVRVEVAPQKKPAAPTGLDAN